MYGRFQRESRAVASHAFTSDWNCSVVMPVSVAARILKRSSIESLAMAARSPDNTVLNGWLFASSGFAFTTAGTRSMQ